MLSWRRTHHDTTVETLGSNSDDNILAHTFQDLRPADDEAICMREFALFAVERLLALFERQFLDGVRFTGSARLVALDIVAAKENTVTRYNFTRFQQRDVANDNFLQNTIIVSESRGPCRIES